jgi:hypothetical protein
MKAVDLGSLSCVPGALPPSPQLVFEAYSILNASRDPGPQVSLRATLRCGICQSPKDGAGEVPNTRVGNIAVVQFRGERNFSFQVGLEFGPVSASDIRSIWWVLEG